MGHREKFKTIIGAMLGVAALLHWFTMALYVILLAGMAVTLIALLIKNRTVIFSGDLFRLDASDIVFLACCVSSAVLLFGSDWQSRVTYAVIAVIATIVRKLYVRQPIVTEQDNH
jgi:hypothetical protein